MGETLQIDEENLGKGLLGLVLALVEIVSEILKLQAVRRMDGGDLTDAEVERLGGTLMKLEATIEGLKEELGVADEVSALRRDLDRLLEGALVRAPATENGEGTRWTGDENPRL